jgi:RsiW-degrading membrane proteinase PrsW (M82 family)
MKPMKITLWLLLVLAMFIPVIFFVLILRHDNCRPQGIDGLVELGLVAAFLSLGRTAVFEHPWKKSQP